MDLVCCVCVVCVYEEIVVGGWASGEQQHDYERTCRHALMLAPFGTDATPLSTCWLVWPSHLGFASVVVSPGNGPGGRRKAECSQNVVARLGEVVKRQNSW